MVKRIVADRCWGAIIDVQELFISQTDKRLWSKITKNINNFARLLGHFRIPIVFTLERPVEQKGGLPEEGSKHVVRAARILGKDFFDLTREQEIAQYIARLKKKQVGVAGCETQGCRLRFCLAVLW